MLRRATGPNPSSSGAAGAAVNIDSKSQNSDYGSFCNTPNCDTVTTTGGATSTGAAKEGARGRSGGGGTSPPTSGGQPAPDDDDDDKEEDNSILVSGIPLRHV